MFTGLIEEIGTIKEIASLGQAKKIKIQCQKILSDIKIDDSISIAGVCQTVVQFDNSSFSVIAVEETIRKTTFNNLKINTKVNLERALKLDSRLGGHIVQGHVDCVGKLISIDKESTGHIYKFEFPNEFSKYISRTGSISINGVSLTVSDINQNYFKVALIPHTREITTLGLLKSGEVVNLEFDVLAKYLERLINTHQTEKQDHNSNSILDQFISQPY